MTAPSSLEGYLSVPLPPDEPEDIESPPEVTPEETPEPAQPEVPEHVRVADAPHWKALVYPNVQPGYEVSDRGVVRSPNGKRLQPNRQGQHLWVALRNKDDGTTSARIDKLVLAAFIGWEPMMSPRHKDENTFNNAVENLEWGEPNAQERIALLHQEERRQGLRTTRLGTPRGTPGKTKGKKRDTSTRIKDKNTANYKRPARPAAPAMPSGIVATRRYAFEDISIEVGEDGALMSVTPDPNRVRYTPHQTAIFCQLMARVDELGTLLGVR